ncbi:hypothetical protein GCM10022419_115230 [Nonomuraea rosea]|uniref:Uncharacterized protein n=1 Tax=Nonomuraea rosea TaxID=638574 RepID=A0ABP6ZIU8_9ACTN
MGLLIELLVVAAACWWLYRCVVNPWRTRRSGAVVSGEHDAGVWVNPVRWAQIVAELEGDPEARDRGKGNTR